MPAKPPIFPNSIVPFLRDLARHNEKPWMDANRERYRQELVEPFRALLDRLAPEAQELNPRFVVTGRVGDNFSRINRDIRFARDKTPYRPQMYLFFSEKGGETGQLYIGASGEMVTCGFRIYAQERTSPLVRIGRARAAGHCLWIGRQRKKLGRVCESYWYSSEKGEWTKHPGWPVKPEDWKKLQGWIVRRKFTPAAAVRAGFAAEVRKIFRQAYPLCLFAGSPEWKG